MLSLPQLTANLPPTPNPLRTSHRFNFQVSVPSKTSAISSVRCVAVRNGDPQQDEEFQVLTAMRSMYNDILIVDSPSSRMLLLDDSHSVHSIMRKGQKWTDSYWDEFASLPAIIPSGPIAILGLGGGTVAHLLLDLWPSLQLHGWELDQILIDQARLHFGLSDLEKATDSGGFLCVHVGNALSSSATIPGGFAGIVVDLFADGDVLPELEETETWLQLRERLMPEGRIVVNCGGSDDEMYDAIDDNAFSVYRNLEDNSALRAMSSAFGDQLNWKKLPRANGGNYFALTGPLPDPTSWSENVPQRLRSSVEQWKSAL